MKTILLACGAGIATSTALAAKIERFLDGHGYAGKFRIIQTPVAQAVEASATADLLVATTIRPSGLKCPYMAGIPLLTGIGRDEIENDLLRFMEE